MTIFRGTVLDTPDDPFAGGALRSSADEGLLVHNGEIVARTSFAELSRLHPEEPVEDLRAGLILPGFIDTHVHFPQVRVIGGLGMPLLDWLEQCALPEEARLASPAYAEEVAREFLSGLVSAGTTTALVFGSHFASAVDLLFAAAAEVGLRVTSGLVVSDRILRQDLLTDPDRAYDESFGLAKRWHGNGRLRYAVTPRFSLSCTDSLLSSCSSLLSDVDGAFFTSHLNENTTEIATVTQLFGQPHYLDSYAAHDLVNPRSVFAHNVHPADPELRLLAERGSSVAHCPTSNASLGSGLFPLARHRIYGVHVALGSDVGAGTGFSLLKEGLQAYFAQRLLGQTGFPLAPRHLLHLATTAGALALELPTVGHLGIGMRFDAQWLSSAPGSVLDAGLRNATSAEDALAKVFTLGTVSDVRRVWVDGALVSAWSGRDAEAERGTSSRR